MVVPTHVGMARKTPGSKVQPVRSPHARGDGPPRLFLEDPEVKVVPTHVGMARDGHLPRGVRNGSPHARGDGPTISRARAARAV